MNSKNALSGWLLAALPVTLFFPVGVMYALIALAVAASIVSGAQWRHRSFAISNPVVVPALLLFGLVLLQAIFFSAGIERRWTGTVHYAVFGFFLLFVSLHEDRWYLLAKRMLFAGAVYAALTFCLARLGVLPDWHIFKNYQVYGGNKSISLGIFMAIAAAWMLDDATRAVDRRTAGLYLLGYLLVAVVVVMFATTRTGLVLLFLLSAIVALRRLRLNWRTLLFFAVALGLLAVLWKTGVKSIERLQRTSNAIVALSQGQSSAGVNNRVQFIQKTGEMIAEKPLLGHGIGSWQQQYPVRAQGLETAFMSTPHNDYLLYAAELGAVGLVALGLVLASLLRTAWQAPDGSGSAMLIVTVAMVVGSLFNAILRDWRFGVPFMLMLAIAYREMLAGATQAKVRRAPATAAVAA